jgi:hypothetical protein
VPRQTRSLKESYRMGVSSSFTTGHPAVDPLVALGYRAGSFTIVGQAAAADSAPRAHRFS